MTIEVENSEKEKLRRRFSEFSRYGRKFDRAIDTALAGGVKETRFLPSGRRFLTVVGTLGDEFIDPEKPYCSCSNFYFKVMNGRDELCYHLLSFRIASPAGMVDATEFSDEEYEAVLKATVNDIFDVIHRS
jgi:predicted nucleic acid-binding Zn finger protein